MFPGENSFNKGWGWGGMDVVGVPVFDVFNSLFFGNGSCVCVNERVYGMFSAVM